MADNMFGKPNEIYYVHGQNYHADGNGKILSVGDANDRLALRNMGCIEKDIVAEAASDGGLVMSVAGRTGDVTLSLSDITDAGTAAASDATDFDAAGAAATVQAGLGTAAAADSTDFDAAGAASAAQAAAEAFATAADAPAFEGSVTTHDDTSNVVVAAYTPPHNSFVQVEAAFVGRQQDGSNAKARKATASFLTDNAGVVTQVGTTLAGATQNTMGAAAWAQGIQTDGSVVNIVVTGAAATDIDWHVEGDVTSVP